MKHRTNNLILTIALLLALVILTDTAMAVRCQIRIRNQASLDSGPVTFGDIGWVACDDPAVKSRIETMVVSHLSNDVNQLKLDNYHLNRILVRAGINPGSIDIYGATSCSVSMENAPKITTLVTPVTPTVIKPQASEKKTFTLTDQLAAEISRSTSIQQDCLMIDWHCRHDLILMQPADKTRFTVKRKSPVALGRVNFEIIDNDPSKMVTQKATPLRKTLRQKYYIQADVKFIAQAIVTQRAISAGTVITQDDIMQMPEPVTDLSRCGITDPDLVIGQEASRTIRANQIIMSSMIKKMTLVKRNQQVDVLTSSGSIKLNLKGRAMVDGGMGDIITVRTEYIRSQPGKRSTSRKVKDVYMVTGKVTAPGQVTIFMPGHDKTVPKRHYAKTNRRNNSRMAKAGHSISIANSLGSY